MIDKKILIIKLRDFSINYDIPLKDEYITFIANELNAEGFTNEDFITAIKTIMRRDNTTYGKMPNLAMFIEARPEKPREPVKLRIEHKKPEQHVLNKLSTEERKKLIEHVDKKLKARIYTSKADQQKQQSYWDKYLEDNPANLKDNPIQQGVRSPQLQKLKEQNK